MMTMTCSPHYHPTVNADSVSHIAMVLSGGRSMRLPCQQQLSLSRHRHMSLP